MIEVIGQDGQVERGKLGSVEGVSISLSIRPTDRPGNPAPAPEVSEEQFEVVDPSGRLWTAMPRIMSGAEPRVQGNEVRFSIQPSDKDLKPMPWPRDFKGFTLRYREMTVVPVDIPFEFKDVPLP